MHTSRSANSLQLMGGSSLRVPGVRSLDAYPEDPARGGRKYVTGQNQARFSHGLFPNMRYSLLLRSHNFLNKVFLGRLCDI